jgi:hypothetical protein
VSFGQIWRIIFFISYTFSRPFFFLLLFLNVCFVVLVYQHDVVAVRLLVVVPSKLYAVVKLSIASCALVLTANYSMLEARLVLRIAMRFSLMLIVVGKANEALATESTVPCSLCTFELRLSPKRLLETIKRR